MTKQNLKPLVLGDNHFGALELRVLDLLSPMTGTGAPTVAAEFYGQEYHDITNPLSSVIYKATGMGNVVVASDWSVITQTT